MERWRRWRRDVEVEITPVEGANREISVTTLEKTNRHFLDLGEFSDNKGRLEWRNRLRLIAATILGIDAIAELYKAASPFISPSLINYPTLNQLSNQISTYSENPLAIGVIAAVGAYYLGKNIYRERKLLHAINAGFHRIQIAPMDLRVSPLDPPEPTDEVHENHENHTGSP